LQIATKPLHDIIDTPKEPTNALSNILSFTLYNVYRLAIVHFVTDDRQLTDDKRTTDRRLTISTNRYGRLTTSITRQI